MAGLLFGSVHREAHAIDVFVDFTSDFHDGDSSDNFVDGVETATPDGIPDWIQELNQGTAAAGVADFSESERALIEGVILSELNRVYEGTTLNFVTEKPVSGDYEVIYFGRDNDSPEISDTNRGAAFLDTANRQTQVYTEVGSDPSGVARVTTRNIVEQDIESTDSRDTQIAEFSIGIAGTAAHELGHLFGLEHQFAFSAPGITPDNYEDTGGLQDAFIIGTGSTGLGELARQQPRSLSPFSQVTLDISGGSTSFVGDGAENNSLIPGGGIASDPSELFFGVDAGDTLDTAQALSFETGALSGKEISFVEADLDGTTSDVDVFSFSTTTSVTLSANVFSNALSFEPFEFDPNLELLDSDGNVLFSITDTSFDDDNFVDFESPEEVDVDPFLVNIPLEAGEYFLRVTANLDSEVEAAEVGAPFYLVTALIPPLNGDVNGDGVVDLADFEVIRENFFATGVPGEVVGEAPGAIDGSVDLDDFLAFRNAFEAAGGDTALLSFGFLVAVPEPGTATAALVMFGSLLCRRRRADRDV